MIKIEKLAPRMWAGNGFGYTSAWWGVKDRTDIKVTNKDQQWKAYIKRNDDRYDVFKAATRLELQAMLNMHNNHA